MNKQELLKAMRRSGGGQNAVDELDDLWLRAHYLEQTRRYGLLLSQIKKTNNKSNFLALVLELNFAYQFELKSLNLNYEINSTTQGNSTVDFQYTMSGGERVLFEFRLLQQAKSIFDLIRAQLQKSGCFGVFMDGSKEKDEVVRIQNTILGKVQNKHGEPIKFSSTPGDEVNIVVVDVTDSVFGAVDVHDCMLAMYGDDSVEEAFQRGVFGVFQENSVVLPEHLKELAFKFEYIRSILHGVLFLFKVPDTGILAYRLEQLLIWNRALIEDSRAATIFKEISSAVPLRSVM